MKSINDNNVIIKNYLSKQDYVKIFQQMKNFTLNRDENTIDEILLLEHNPVYTMGNIADESHILRNNNIPIVYSDRGGQVTYHGPGQLVIYFLIDLKRRQKYVKDFNFRSLVDVIENSVIKLLDQLGIIAFSRKDAPGVYINFSNPLNKSDFTNDVVKKVSSLGVKITKQGSYHGVAINFDADLQPFLDINPCGYNGLRMCNIKEIETMAISSKDGDIQNLQMHILKEMFLQIFLNALNYSAFEILNLN